MKLVALALMAFALLTALYAALVVVPKYRRVNREWVSHPRGGMEGERYRLRSRCQSYATGAVIPAVLALVLAVLTRKRPGFPPAAALGGGAVLTLAIVGFMQALGNFF